MSNLISMIAGPLNVYGPENKVYSIFTDKPKCKISVFQNNTKGNILIQVRYNTDHSTGDWIDYIESTEINSQVVYCRVTSTLTGGVVVLKIDDFSTVEAAISEVNLGVGCRKCLEAAQLEYVICEIGANGDIEEIEKCRVVLVESIAKCRLNYDDCAQ